MQRHVSVHAGAFTSSFHSHDVNVPEQCFPCVLGLIYLRLSVGVFHLPVGLLFEPAQLCAQLMMRALMLLGMGGV